MTQFVEKYANGGKVVELGCGDGSLAGSVKPECFSHWYGMDISSEAVQKAKDRKIPNCSFQVGDIAEWIGGGSINLVIIEEALYYLSRTEQRELLKRCQKSLAPYGKIIVTTHDGKKHRSMVENCLAASPDANIEKHGQRTYIFIS